MGENYAQLSAEERGVIMLMKAEGSSSRQIAVVLSRSASTISRELRRNGHTPPTGRRGRPRLAYDATRAGARARRLRHLPRGPRKLARSSALWRRVRRMLERRWSPQQVASTLRLWYPQQPRQRVSHETI